MTHPVGRVRPLVALDRHGLLDLCRDRLAGVRERERASSVDLSVSDALRWREQCLTVP